MKVYAGLDGGSTYLKAALLDEHKRVIRTGVTSTGIDNNASAKKLLKKLNQEDGMTIVVVTHESGVANETNKIVHIKDGIIGQIEENLDHNASPFGATGLMK